jgi:hypothetical protein
MDAMFPYDLTKIGNVGRVRCLYAPTSVAIPADISGIIDMVSPYAPKTGWVDFGAAKSNASYSRNAAGSGIDIEQETAAIFEAITDVSRQFTLSLSQWDENVMQIIENAPSIGTIASGTGKSAQKSVLVGGFQAFTSFRLALIGMRHPDSGLVTETGGVTRGRLICTMAYRASLTSDNVSADFEKGALSELKPVFEAKPEPGQPSGKDYGGWLFESAGTIA